MPELGFGDGRRKWKLTTEEVRKLWKLIKIRVSESASISQLETDVTQLQADLLALGDLSGLLSDISDLQNDVSTINSSISSIDSRVTTLEGEVKESFVYITAETNSALSASSFQWSFGDSGGASGNGVTILIPAGWAAEIYGASYNIGGFSPSGSVLIYVNGSEEHSVTISGGGTNVQRFGSPTTLSGLDVVNIRTGPSVSGTSAPSTFTVIVRMYNS